MAVGIVKFFIPPKGWGFIIETSETGAQCECLVHYTDIQSDKPYKKLYKGQIVEFTKIYSSTGHRAIDVKPNIINGSTKRIG